MKLQFLSGPAGIVLLALSSAAPVAQESLIDKVGAAVGDFFPGRQLEKAERLQAPDDIYNRALFDGYLKLSRTEYSEADYGDSDVFAERAMRSARGEVFQPEAISARDLPTELLNLAAGRRLDLRTAQLRGAAAGIPDWAAEAQLSFDCWMQEQEEDFQIDDIAACVERFDLAMEKISVFLDPTTIPEPTARLDRFVSEVFFDFDSAELSAEARENIEAFAEWTILYKEPVVSVIGNADQAGRANYNFELSQRRADAVASILETIGVKLDGIFARGDQAPAVDRIDRAPDRINRRVLLVVREAR